MIKPLRVVFFGTPEFAKTALEQIHSSAHQIVGVVTVADKASGRGQKVQTSPVKNFAVENKLPLFQPEKLRDETFLAEMQALNADVFVVVAFRMMPKVLFDLPTLGTFNLHASLLPDYRGAAPINYAIINGEIKTGVTTFFINEKIDEGNILMQQEIAIGPQETAGELHDRLMHLGAEVILKTLDGLAEGKLQAKPQPAVDVPKNAFKIFKEDTIINWDHSTIDIYNFIRGMSPYPCAFTRINLDGTVKTLKIFNGRYDVETSSAAPGTILINKNVFGIHTADGLFYPAEVQLEGKKRMNVQDFLNGIRSFENIWLAEE